MELNSDILFEILSRSSIKTVAKCRVLSKECNRISHESSFVNLHCQRTTTLSGFFLQTMKKNEHYSTFISVQNSASNHNLSLDFLPVPVKIEAASAQGILICVGAGSRNRTIPRYYVCKPSTKEWEKIPNPKTRYSTIRTGIVVLRSNPLQYKIVRFSYQPQLCDYTYNYLRCEIFDSVSRQWRQLEQVKLAYDEYLRYYAPTVSASGNLHWLTTDNNVLAFDLEAENYTVFSLPSSVHDFDCNTLLTYYEGKLGVIFMVEEMSCFELWVMEIYEQKTWAKREKISIESLRKLEPYTSPVGFYASDVALMSGFCQIMFFKFKNGISTDKVKLQNDFKSSEIFPIRSDFEICNLNNQFLKKRNRAKPWKKCINHSSFVLSPALLLLLLFYCLCYTFDL